MSKLFVDHFLASHEKPPKEIVLDFDATDDLIHGQQNGRFYLERLNTQQDPGTAHVVSS